MGTQAIPKRKRGGSDSEGEAAGENDGEVEVADKGEGVESPSAKVAKTAPPTEQSAGAAEAPKEQAE